MERVRPRTLLAIAAASAAFYYLLPELTEGPKQLAGPAVGPLDMAAGGHRLLGADLPGQAFGGGAGIAKIGAIYMASAAVAAASPTPGGVGAIEPLLIAGLAAPASRREGPFPR